MTISHKAGHYCHFRVLHSVDRFIVIQTYRQEKKCFGIYWEGHDTFDLKTCAKGGGQNYMRGEFVPVTDCMGEEGASLACDLGLYTHQKTFVVWRVCTESDSQEILGKTWSIQSLACNDHLPMSIVMLNLARFWLSRGVFSLCATASDSLLTMYS